nr:hypothetical protein [Thermoanaerobacterales bacterium]
MVTGTGVLRRLGRRSLAAAGGLALDRLLGEPPVPDRAHPVALLGTGLAALERRLYADRRAPGAALAAAAVAGAAVAGAALRSPAAAAWLATSGRGLPEAALPAGAPPGTAALAAPRGRPSGRGGADPRRRGGPAPARGATEGGGRKTTRAAGARGVW